MRCCGRSRSSPSCRSSRCWSWPWSRPGPGRGTGASRSSARPGSPTAPVRSTARSGHGRSRRAGLALRERRSVRPGGRCAVAAGPRRRLPLEPRGGRHLARPRGRWRGRRGLAGAAVRPRGARTVARGSRAVAGPGLPVRAGPGPGPERRAGCAGRGGEPFRGARRGRGGGPGADPAPDARLGGATAYADPDRRPSGRADRPGERGAGPAGARVCRTPGSPSGWSSPGVRSSIMWRRS